MALSLQNKRVLITGSTDGLGKLLARNLIGEGARVIVHGKDVQKVERIVQELGATEGIVCDFNQPNTVQQAFSNLTELDVLINNAGVWLEGPTINGDVSRGIELTNVILASHVALSRTLLPTLLRAEFGQLLNVVSIAGVEIPFDYYHTVYSAAKFGLQAFSEALAKEFDNTNLRVMGYYPGGMETKLFEKAGENYKEHEPWMFDPQESVDAIKFMLTRNKKVSIKRMDLINHLQE